ncbi:MAG TPA: YceI family protein [Solimonas sp.]|nr:YceI family protein [Solimonas sp.]
MRLLRSLTLPLLLLALPLAQAAPRPLVAERSEIAFSVKQMGVPVSGKFTRFEALVDLDLAKPEAGSAKLSVDIASLSTGDEEADAVALDKPWLDRAGFPKASFQSSGVKALGGERYEARGTLTIRGKSRPLTVPFSAQPQKDGSLRLAGEFSLRRADFGIGGGEWNEGDLVAPEVPVRFTLWLAPAR